MRLTTESSASAGCSYSRVVGLVAHRRWCPTAATRSNWRPVLEPRIKFMRRGWSEQRKDSNQPQDSNPLTSCERCTERNRKNPTVVHFSNLLGTVGRTEGPADKYVENRIDGSETRLLYMLGSRFVRGQFS